MIGWISMPVSRLNSTWRSGRTPDPCIVVVVARMNDFFGASRAQAANSNAIAASERRILLLHRRAAASQELVLAQLQIIARRTVAHDAGVDLAGQLAGEMRIDV